MTTCHETAAGAGRLPGLHVREHRSVLAAAEKRALVWMAERLPGRVTSDHLSVLGLVSMLGVGLAFGAASWFPAAALPAVVVCLALNWLGDSLDGTLARVRNRQRPRYGFYVDHVIDAAGTTFMLVGLAASGYMAPWIALGCLVAFLLVSIESYLGTHARGVFRMSFLGFGPTELRIVIAAGALWLLRGAEISPFGFGPWRLFDVGGLVAIAGLGAAFVVSAARNASALYREETFWR
jgi:phosphatidylglycerophosphate synthase